MRRPLYEYTMDVTRREIIVAPTYEQAEEKIQGDVQKVEHVETCPHDDDTDDDRNEERP